MNPEVDAVLRDIAQQINEQVCPSIEGYHRGTLSMAAVMLTMVADQWDDAAHNRVMENNAIRALLQMGAALVHGERADALLDLSKRQDHDFRISVLDRANVVLREALTQLQITLECDDSKASRSLQARIWDELRISTERRGVSAAPF